MKLIFPHIIFNEPQNINFAKKDSVAATSPRVWDSSHFSVQVILLYKYPILKQSSVILVHRCDYVCIEYIRALWNWINWQMQSKVENRNIPFRDQLSQDSWANIYREVFDQKKFIYEFKSHSRRSHSRLFKLFNPKAQYHQTGPKERQHSQHIMGTTYNSLDVKS